MTAMHRCPLLLPPHLHSTAPAQRCPPAVADVWQLLPAKAHLESRLGPAAAAQAAALSAGYSQWLLDPQDRLGESSGSCCLLVCKAA